MKVNTKKIENNALSNAFDVAFVYHSFLVHQSNHYQKNMFSLLMDDTTNSLGIIYADFSLFFS